MAKFINLTPHTVRIVMDDNAIEFPSEGTARAQQSSVVTDSIEGIEIVELTFGDVIGLPEYSEGVYYIVSLITAQAADRHGRRTDDLFLTANPVRDDEGRIIGCRNLMRYAS
jgi:hypothetical protein